jgi:hypothetical protein
VANNDITASLTLRDRQRFSRDASIASKDITGIGRAATRAHRGIAAFGRGLLTVAKVGVAAGIVGAVGVARFMKTSLDGYRDHVKLLKITRQVIKSTGGAAGYTAGQMSALSDAVEAKTGVDGDAILSGENLLATFTHVRREAGKGNDIFKRSTRMLADMSVALGTDASGSAIQLGKALNDPVKGVSALSRVGVSFNDKQKKHIATFVKHNNVLGAQKIILHELRKEFGGAAAAAMSPADKLTVSYHQLQDTVGKLLLPTFNRIATVVATKVVPRLSELANKYGPRVIAFLGRAAKHAQQMYAAFKAKNGASITGGLRSLRDVLKQLAPKVKAAADRLPAFTTVLDKGRGVVKFFARHTTLLKVALGGLVAALVLHKAAQTASNTVGKNSVIGFVAQTFSTTALAASNFVLASAMRATSTVEKQSILTRARGTIGTIASSVASKVAAGASKVWAAGQWLLNAAMTANPIGLVVVAVGLLVGGIILAYKKSETFRRIVNGAFRAVGTFVLGVVDKILGAVQGFMEGLGHLPGKLGAPFRAAADKIQTARDKIAGLKTDLANFGKPKIKVTIVADHAGFSRYLKTLSTPGAGTGLGVSLPAPDPTDPTRARGGPVARGRRYTVGEHGAETFVAPWNGRIEPHDDNPGAAAGPRIIQLVVDRKVLAQVVDDEVATVRARHR